MARPRFSEMLINRRRQLGLSVKQASNVLRLREDVLIAFEEGDFESMPKSGYAQGMLSSYARYLGLNPRQVTNQFSADLSDWEHGGSGRSMAGRGGSRRGRRGEPSYEVPSGERYEGSRGLLPTSGGYAGDVYGYATTSQAHSRGQRPSPLVNQGRVSSDIDSRGEARGGETHRYSGRDLSTYSTGRDAQRTMRYRAQADRSGYASRYRGSEGIADRSTRDRVSVRRVSATDYTDDLRYDNALPYEAASTRSGRRSSRNIARVDRPNIQRRGPGRDSRGDMRGRSAETRRGGVIGFIEAFFSDSRRTLALVLVVAAAVLTVVIISSVGACVNKNSSTGRTVSVSTSSDSGNDSSKGETDSSKNTQETEKAAADAVAAKKTKEDAAAKTETKVEVSVGDGEVSWVEIENDGKSLVAEQITGPWKQSYVVTGQFTIQVSDTTAVTVTKNGETQKFDNKTSGIGSITIVGTKVSSSTTTGTSSDAAGGNTSADASKSTATGGDEGSTAASRSGSASGDSDGEADAETSSSQSRTLSNQTVDEQGDESTSASSASSNARSSTGTSSSYSYFSND
ncbi:MAG: helix-turn-helix domain-containing protein [Olsenella sp.]|nr:helix-turn-helix domain-containing protein [Olsenella sp.]